MRTQVKRAFTLIEILIVVVILGILAAIVIPQFTDASEQAQRSSVVSQLQTLRGQIELYRVKNGGLNPDLSADWDDMITPVDANGDPLPPYLQSPPRNPLMAQGSQDTVGAAGTAWIWDDALNGSGVLQIYAWDPVAAAIFDEDGDGNPG